MRRLITFTAIRRRQSPVLLGFILAFVLVSCVQTNLINKAIAGSQIILSSSAEPNTFNPQLMEQGVGILTFLYEGLIRENGRGEIKPALARSWETSEDQKRIIFTLRKELKWSDGKPLTADDVVFTYKEVNR